jgi:hydroxymethylpyrimidine/phosphomethylpyrimidine kinase
VATQRPRRICVLTIAGSDSGAGAGIQADARTIQALGGYALTAITAVTAQNGRGVKSWTRVPPAMIGDQATAVFEGFAVAAAKTGLLPGPGAVRAVARALAARRGLPLVVDPVIGSTSGTRFLSPAGVRVLKRELLPLAALATPNWPEAEALAGLRVRSEAEAEKAALRLAAQCGCAVLVKGGHGRGAWVRDCLATSDGRVRWYSGRRIATHNTHGTGCVLSAAIALELGRGRRLEVAVARARRFLERALHTGQGRDWGSGAGPAFAG